MGVNIRRAQVMAEDRATKEIMGGRILQKTIQLIMFGTEDNANWGAERAVRRAAYPFAEGQIECNRTAFKHEVGDAFKLSDSTYSIVDMVARVLNIKEGAVDTEDIIINWMEDPDYVTSAASIGESTTGGTIRDYTIYDLEDITIVEAPYALVGESIQVIPIVPRMSGQETGFEVYVSFDGGTSYIYLTDLQYYAVHGVLTNEVHIDLNTLDKITGFDVDFSLTGDAYALQVITRAQMFAGYNTCMIGTGNTAELLAFETITPDAVVTDRYKISDINRGRFDSIKKTWPLGTDFYFLGTNAIQLVSHPQFIKGTVRYFKLVPYNPKRVGEIANANPEAVTLVGRAYAPYVPSNLRANGVGQNPLYQTQVQLTWDPRIRGTGAGVGDPDSVVDAAPTHEGKFEIEVWVSSIKVRTVTDLGVYTWTYTYDMNIADNTSLAPTIVFKLRNYITTGGVRYDSIHDRELTVNRNPDVLPTTTTTTTTTTTSAAATTTT